MSDFTKDDNYSFKSEVIVLLSLSAFITISTILLMVIISYLQNDIFNIIPIAIIGASTALIFICLLKIDELLGVDKTNMKKRNKNYWNIFHIFIILYAIFLTFLYNPIYIPSIGIISIIVPPVLLSLIIKYNR